MFRDKLIIHPGKLRGQVAAPPSKSMTQRVLAALLRRPASLTIHNAGTSADERVVMRVLRDAGFSLRHMADDVLHIEASVTPQPITHADFGESGLAARMLTPIVALGKELVRLEGAPGLRSRPMRFLEEDLPRLGVRTGSNDGYLPASVQGPLHPADITLDAHGTSQFLSGLLMAYAGTQDVTITVHNLVSRPYIDLTLQVMERMGMPLPEVRANNTFCFPPDPVWRKPPASITIEGDWSGAAFLLVAGALAGDSLRVTGLDAFTTQGDKHVLSALMDAGASLSIESTQIGVTAARLKAFHFNATHFPDLFPPLAALACYADGTSIIEGIGRLAGKESNRAETIVSELQKMGASITLQDDLMIINGGRPLHGAQVHSHNDHRIAMMCAVAALRADGPTTIGGAEAITKSYPRFWEDLQSLGARIEAAG